MSTPTFSHSVPVRDMPAEGKRFEIHADAGEREGLAEQLDLLAVEELRAELEVRPVAGRAFRVRGRLTGTVVQTCVVTLEPVRQPISDEVDVTLMRAEDVAADAKQGDALVDVAELEGPEVFQNGRIDLGVIAAEHLALALDPYPRAPGVQFPGHVEDDPSADPSPFAALARLKKGGE